MRQGLWPPSQILALRVYIMPTISTISRPCLHVADLVYRLQTTFSCARVNGGTVGMGGCWNEPDGQLAGRPAGPPSHEPSSGLFHPAPLCASSKPKAAGWQPVGVGHPLALNGQRPALGSHATVFDTSMDSRYSIHFAGSCFLSDPSVSLYVSWMSWISVAGARGVRLWYSFLAIVYAECLC